MKVETNLPVVFLTLLVIIIVIIGYLEFKKLNERIKMLEYLNKGKGNKGPPEKSVDNVVIEKVENPVVDQKATNQAQTHNEVISERNNNRVQEWQMNNEKDNIINTLNKKEEYIEEIDDNQHVFFNRGVFPPQPQMMYKVMEVDERDEIIEKINNDETINFENNIPEEKVLISEIGDEVNKEVNIDSDEKGSENNLNPEEEHGIESKEEEQNISSDESVEEINLKEINEEDEFSKNKIIVDESFSVNALKTICKNLGIQSSGNKTTLIKRIMDNQ